MSASRSQRPQRPAPAAPPERSAPLAHAAGRQGPGEVRLIGGMWKRRKLPVPPYPGLRPTPDRVRETLFNWLGQDLSGWHVLDAFAGSGALGFEAASRGATEVLLIEREAALVRALEASRQRLQATTLQVTGADALVWMSRCAPGRFELILLDPPFGAGIGERALLLAVPLVAAGGFIYLESGEPLLHPPPGFELWRTLRAGVVHAQLLRHAA